LDDFDLILAACSLAHALDLVTNTVETFPTDSRPQIRERGDGMTRNVKESSLGKEIKDFSLDLISANFQIYIDQGIPANPLHWVSLQKQAYR
jgi:hypothetical protein